MANWKAPISFGGAMYSWDEAAGNWVAVSKE